MILAARCSIETMHLARQARSEAVSHSYANPSPGSLIQLTRIKVPEGPFQSQHLSSSPVGYEELSA